jgi:hypothetical protein
MAPHPLQPDARRLPAHDQRVQQLPYVAGEAQFELWLATLAHGLLPNHATARRRHATRCHGYANLLKMDSASRP